MTTSIKPEAVKTGDEVKVTFKDNLSHFVSGKVIAVATYDVAKSMNTDLAARHSSIQALVAKQGAILRAVTEETFLIIDTGDARPTVVAFDWIPANGLELIERGATFRIKILNSSRSEADKALAILRQNGLACQLDVLY